MVRNLTGMYRSQTILCIPSCVCLRSELNATEQAQRICCFRIDCLGLILPVEGQGQAVFFLVEYQILRQIVYNEVFTYNLQTTVIYIKVLIKVHLCTNFCQYADTLCQL